ncbi:MAG: hypothetical protein AAF757_31455 [Cyanobacteria bacterium P01_D01_bin.116]
MEKGEESTFNQGDVESSKPIENGNKRNFKGRTTRSKKVKSQQENEINTQLVKNNKKDLSSQDNAHSFQPQVYSDDDL